MPINEKKIYLYIYMNLQPIFALLRVLEIAHDIVKYSFYFFLLFKVCYEIQIYYF